MTQDKWDEVKDMVKSKFEVLEEKVEPLFLKTGLIDADQQKIGDKDVLVFDGPMGKIKLEYLVKPVVLDKKEHYTKRGGTSSQTEYILSDTEFVRRMEAFRWINGFWEKIDASSFGG